MHKLLARQLKRYIGAIDAFPESWQRFLGVVDAAYEQADADRALLEHALEVTSQELIARNQELQHDIAERKKTQEALRQSEERYRALVELAPDGIGIHCEGKIVFINPAGVKLLGAQNAAQVMAKPLLEYVHPDYREVVVARIQAMHAAQISTPLQEEKFVRLDGTSFDVEVMAMPFTFDHQPAIQIIFRDITERKRAEEQRLAMERKLLETQRLESLGVLAGGIAHDFNNLLVAILGNADLALLDLAPDVPARDSIQQIQLASYRAAELTQQMLAYAGKGRFVIQPLDLNGLVAEMAPLLRAAIPKRVTVRTRQIAGVAKIDADATQIRQVVMNLLINAAEAMGDQEGVVTLTTAVCPVEQIDLASYYLAPDLPAREYVILEVADTGRGMDAETLAKIFEPFFTTKFVGRGLGLASVIGIVRAHHGAIKIASTVGQGTTFTILLPSCDSAVTAPARGDGAALTGIGTILVVDDEEDVRSITTRMLEREGITVLTANEGPVGVDVFRTQPQRITCVLLDLTMPRMTGEETFRMLRTVRAEVPIVLMSGYSGEEVMARFVGERRVGFLAKPFNPAMLRSVVRQVLMEQ
jgi:two-component system cell cycle sensor histidine kinase/response regulator CckA